MPPLSFIEKNVDFCLKSSFTKKLAKKLRELVEI